MYYNTKFSIISGGLFLLRLNLLVCMAHLSVLFDLSACIPGFEHKNAAKFEKIHITGFLIKENLIRLISSFPHTYFHDIDRFF
jgi:hypothetical protein